MNHKPLIAVCFFGIPRSIRYTAGSIRKNVLGPANLNGQVRTFGHFFDQKRIVNERTGEDTFSLDVMEDWFKLDEVEISAPNRPEILDVFESARKFGDQWGDDEKSLKNLIHQLYSISRVTALASTHNPDMILYVRPDLNYHDSLDLVLQKAVRFASANRAMVFTPEWQCWGGLNDRFAIAVGKKAFMTYGSRFDKAIEYCEEASRPLHSERLVSYALRSSGVDYTYFRQRASRVRANGVQAWEDFAPRFQTAIQLRLDNRVKSLPKGLYELLTFVNKVTSRLIWGDRYLSIEAPDGVTQRTKVEEEILRSG